jgi:peptidyl-prolyl cis-trans isomerase A (cyclophilin A)
MHARTWTPASLIALSLFAGACRRERPVSEAAAAAPADTAPAPVAKTTDLGSATPKPSAPSTYRARFETSAGTFVIEAQRDWAPGGPDRFYDLVKSGYYDGQRFFRVLTGFMAQFGIHGDPAVSAKWRDRNIPDDSVHQSNTRGMVSFATAGPNTRTTQVFINYGDNSSLDGQGFAPFGRVVEGMNVVDRLYAGYGEGAPRGRGPDQGRLQGEGNAYLAREFPKLDSVKRATIVAPSPSP